jgi:hypothetical protein
MIFEFLVIFSFFRDYDFLGYSWFLVCKPLRKK